MKLFFCQVWIHEWTDYLAHWKSLAPFLQRVRLEDWIRAIALYFIYRTGMKVVSVSSSMSWQESKHILHNVEQMLLEMLLYIVYTQPQQTRCYLITAPPAALINLCLSCVVSEGVLRFHLETVWFIFLIWIIISHILILRWVYVISGAQGKCGALICCSCERSWVWSSERLWNWCVRVYQYPKATCFYCVINTHPITQLTVPHPQMSVWLFYLELQL